MCLWLYFTSEKEYNFVISQGTDVVSNSEFRGNQAW